MSGATVGLSPDGQRAVAEPTVPPQSDEIPRVIRQLVTMRRKAGLSQNKLAERMSTAQSAISELESGVASPTLATLLRYAEQFGMAVVLTVEQEID